MVINRRYHGHHKHHHHALPQTKTRSCMQKIWVPVIPSWEEEFCMKAGLFTWEKFLEAKKYTHLSQSVMNWDDSAAKEAFLNAKNRFRAEINGLHSDIPMPSPDMYIDEIDWNSEMDPSLFSGLASLLDDESDDTILPNPNDAIFNTRIQDIKPAGWDVDVEEFSRPVLLTGLVVGDHCSSDDNSSGVLYEYTKSSNYQNENSCFLLHGLDHRGNYDKLVMPCT